MDVVVSFFVSSMSIFTLDQMKSLKNITLDGNTGHFDNVIDLAGSEGFGRQHQASIVLFVFPNEPGTSEA